MQISYMFTLLKYLNENTPTTIFELHSKIGFSHETIYYAVKAIKQTGLVKAKSGKGGGIWLTKPYHEIYVRDLFPLISPHDFVLLAFARHNQDALLIDILKHIEK